MNAPPPLPTRRRSPAAGRGILSALVAAATLLAWPHVVAWQQQQFAEQLAAHAADSTTVASASIRELQQLGVAATEPLMKLAAVQRPEVARNAQQALADQLAGWEVEFAMRGDVATLAEQLGALSAALEAHAGHFDPVGRHWAQKLARRIVLQCDYLSAEDAWHVLASCEAVLSLPDARLPAEAQLAYANQAPIAEATPNVPPIPMTPAPTTATASTFKQLDSIRSAPLADLSVVMPSTQPPSTPPAAEVAAPPPSRLNPLRPAETPPANGADGTEAASAPQTSDDPSSVVDVPSPLDMRHNKQRLRGLSDQELISLSETALRFEASAAKQVLRSRGYTDQMLRMTQELRRLPATDRRQALDRAGALPAADARRLLRWFVTDADAEVRLHALTLLATTGDPQLPEIARQRAVDDADPRVADLATKLLKAR